MSNLIISSLSRRAGKTAIASALGAHFLSKGISTFLAKAWTSHDDPDNETFANLVPLAARPSPEESPYSNAYFRRVSHDAQISIIEGEAGYDQRNNMQLAEDLDALIILVASYDEDIESAASAYGSRLAGVVINRVPRYRQIEILELRMPALKEKGVATLGMLPEARRLVAPTLDEAVRHLGGEYILMKEKGSRLIDYFLIGGMILDWGPFYFGSRKKAGVIVRGDRPDIQIAALQTSSVHALILTKGVMPVEYVQYEAEQREVPLVFVKDATVEAADKLGQMPLRTSFMHPDKLEYMRGLMTENIDLDAIERAIAFPATR